MRLRLGAVHILADMVCSLCGRCMLDGKAYHALCCDRAHSTIGHNRVRDIVAAHFSKADPGTATEVEGLCPRDPRARPADVLSRAPHNTKIAAVDIGIKAPHATDAGPEPLNAMWSTKVAKYERHREDLELQGIVYEPLILSAYGRRHPNATNMLKLVAAKAARRRGLSSSARLFQWWCRAISLEVWRRAASMVHGCMRARCTDDEHNEEDET